MQNATSQSRTSDMKFAGIRDNSNQAAPPALSGCYDSPDNPFQMSRLACRIIFRSFLKESPLSLRATGDGIIDEAINPFKIIGPNL
jgi:hypothetical protein